MSAQLKIETYITYEEYVIIENASPIKHEYFQGQLYAMAGASQKHNDLCMSVGSSLKTQLRGKSCKPRQSDQRVRVEKSDLSTYPDVVVICPPEKYSDKDGIAATDATVIVEVLSKSTAKYDRGSKFEFYKQLESFRHYVLVAQEEINVEHRFLNAQGEWETEVFTSLDDSFRLETINCALNVGEIYEDIEMVSV